MKCIILGDGLLGSELIKITNFDFLSRKKDGIDFVKIKDWLYKTEEYDTIINCVAYTKTYDSNKQPCWDINYKAVAELADYCKETNKKLIHISTDYVYVGGNASEDDIPMHLPTWYSYTKLLADSYIELRLTNFLIIRTSHKPYPFPYIKAWNNQYTCGDYAPVIANLIVQIIEKNVNGIYNVGTEKKTWYTLTHKEFNTQPIERPEVAPFDVTMRLDKLNNLLKQ